MRQYHKLITIPTTGRGCSNITMQVQSLLQSSGLQSGVVNLLVQHTSCSLMIQECADPDVLHDMEQFLTKLVADGDPDYHHCNEGDDDMAAHIRMALTHVSLAIPFVEGRLALGIWQGIFLYEHRYSSNQRRVVAHLIGE
ncbi:MAG: secondary thiamine-phosphate synthase enzyme YjbQ [Mariprofundales bacterium]|nr:secondary thiamine-phosphate synthase enzyme YjbQ [Mariprofundales bacterium]